jgi:hypothetical protein
MTQIVLRWSFGIGAPVRGASRPASPAFALRPGAETAAALRRCGCWLHQDSTGVMLLSNLSCDASDVFDALTRCLDGMPMRFRMEVDRARIASSSAMPAGTIGLPFFTSRHHRVGRESNAGGVEIDVFELMPQAPQTGSPEGEVWLHPEDLEAALPAIDWRAQLEDVKRPWVYYVINRSQSALTDPTIRDRQGTSFEGPVPVRLDNGEVAMRFDSGAQCYALRTPPDTGCSLYDRARSAWTTDADEVCLIRDLPVPDPHAVEWLGSGVQRRICAAAHVYL